MSADVTSTGSREVSLSPPAAAAFPAFAGGGGLAAGLTAL